MFLYDLMISFANWVWGIPMLVWLVGGGIALSVINRFVQFRRFGYSMKYTMGNITTKTEDGISGYQAVATALAGTIGTGNIIGVGLGIAYGGPGAIFWMWLVGFICMGIKYSEVLASMIYRKKRPDGEYSAGPYMYLQDAFKSKSFGKGMAIAYVVVLFGALLIAAGVHTGATVDAMVQVGANRLIATIGSVLFVAVVVLGGVKRIVSITEKLVPIMSIFYIIGGIMIMVLNAENIIPSLVSIFSHAFQPHSAVGGFAGSTVMLAIRWGTARGMYSSDAGNGIASIIHGQAETKEPVEQALWGIFEVFFDTIIICTFTAMAILTSGSWIEAGTENASMLTSVAFTSTLGAPGTIIITAAIVLFALSTAMSFAYFVENQMSTLLGSTAGKIVQFIFFGIMLIGGTRGVAEIIVLADVTNALAIFINIIGMIALGKVLRKYTEDYFRRVREGTLGDR